MQRQSPPGLGFALRFFAYLLLFSVVFWYFSLHQHLGPVQRRIAALSALGARAVGGQAIARGEDIVVLAMTLTVNHECTGIFVCMLYVAFVLAFPVRWRGRVIGLAIGIAGIFVANVLRLAMLARVVEIYPQAFFYLHEYVWQGLFTVFVLLGAIAWAERYD